MNKRNLTSGQVVHDEHSGKDVRVVDTSNVYAIVEQVKGDKRYEIQLEYLQFKN